MSGELTAADVSWRVRSEGTLQEALRGATVTDSRVSAADDGSVKIVYLEARGPGGRVVISEQGFRLIGDPCKICPGDEGGCKDVPTCDLVAELATREGVTEFTVGVEDGYLVRVCPERDESYGKSDIGPATILVVVD